MDFELIMNKLYESRNPLIMTDVLLFIGNDIMRSVNVIEEIDIELIDIKICLN